MPDRGYCPVCGLGYLGFGEIRLRTVRRAFCACVCFDCDARWLEVWILTDTMSVLTPTREHIEQRIKDNEMDCDPTPIDRIMIPGRIKALKATLATLNETEE